MSKIKSALFALAMAVAVAVGGVVTAAPAQAASITAVVDFRENKSGVAYAVKAYKTNGTIVNLRVGSSTSGVWKVCPINYNRLYWRSSTGAEGVKAPGVCVVPSYGGTWHFGIVAAS